MKPTTIRGYLYAVAFFVAPFTDKLVPILFQNQWPTPQMWVGTVITSIGVTAIGLRAYFDGSIERAKQNGNTTIITK